MPGVLNAHQLWNTSATNLAHKYDRKKWPNQAILAIAPLCFLRGNISLRKCLAYLTCTKCGTQVRLSLRTSTIAKNGQKLPIFVIALLCFLRGPNILRFKSLNSSRNKRTKAEKNGSEKKFAPTQKKCFLKPKNA